MLIQSDFHRWLPVRAARRETQMRQPGRLHRRGLFTSVGAPTVAHASTKRLGVSVRTLINLSPRRSARPAPPRRATISEIPDRISRDRSIPACRARAPGAILIYAGPMLSVGRSVERDGVTAERFGPSRWFASSINPPFVSRRRREMALGQITSRLTFLGAARGASAVCLSAD